MEIIISINLLLKGNIIKITKGHILLDFIKSVGREIVGFIIIEMVSTQSTN